MFGQNFLDLCLILKSLEMKISALTRAVVACFNQCCQKHQLEANACFMPGKNRGFDETSFKVEQLQNETAALVLVALQQVGQYLSP